MATASLGNRVAAVFSNRQDAENAVTWLRGQGVPDSHISVLARHEEDTAHMADTGAARVDAAERTGSGAGKGLLAGAGVGALFGLAALAIPGIGPFVTAGALAEVLGVTGGAAAAGAIVGGTSGAVAGALSKWGLDEADATYYGTEVEQGGYFVAADLAGSSVSQLEVRDAFRRYNGRFREA